MGDQESRPPASTPPQNASGQVTLSHENIGRHTAIWLQNIDNPNNWPNKEQIKQYLKQIQDLLATAPVASTVLANSKMLKQLTSDVDSIKKTVINIKHSTPPMSYRNALTTGLSITPSPKPVTPGHAANEIVIKLGDKEAIATMKSTNEDKLVDLVNGSLRNQQINDVKIRGVTKLGSGDLAIQTNNKEDLNKIKDNDSWIKILSTKARSVTKTYPVLVFTPKMKLYRRCTPEMFQEHLKQWNPHIADNYVAQLHPGKESDVGGLILIFKKEEEANNCIADGVVIDGKMHRVVLYNRECRIKQCFKCYKYGHISSECPNQECCGRCAKNHSTPTKNNPHDRCNAEDPDKCASCGGKHNAWSKLCSVRKREMARIQFAKRNTPIRYGTGLTNVTTATPLYTNSQADKETDIVDVEMGTENDDNDEDDRFQTSQIIGKKRVYRAEAPKPRSYLQDTIGRTPALQRPDREPRSRSLSPAKNPRGSKDRSIPSSMTSSSQASQSQRQPLTPRDPNSISTRRSMQESGQALIWKQGDKGATALDIVSSQVEAQW